VDWSVCMDGVTVENVNKIVAASQMVFSGTPTTTVESSQTLVDMVYAISMSITNSLAATLSVPASLIMDVSVKALGTVAGRRLSLHASMQTRRLSESQQEAMNYSVGFSVVVLSDMDLNSLMSKVRAFSNSSSDMVQKFKDEMQLNGLNVTSFVLTQQPYSIESVILRDATGAIIKVQPEAYASSLDPPTTTLPVIPTDQDAGDDDDPSALFAGIIGGISGLLLLIFVLYYLCRKPSAAEIAQAHRNVNSDNDAIIDIANEPQIDMGEETCEERI